MPEDPAFYLFAIPAVLLIGLAKGGFSGLGALGTPLMALGMDDPVKAAAILLPILIAQDVVGVAAFRKSWDGSVLAAMLPGRGRRHRRSAGCSPRGSPRDAVMAALGAISILFGAYRLWVERGGRIAASSDSPAWVGSLFGIATGFTSQIAHAGGPPFQMWVMPRRLDARRLRRHLGDLLRRRQLDQGPGLCRARPVHPRECARRDLCSCRSRSSPASPACGWCAGSRSSASTRSSTS